MYGTDQFEYCLTSDYDYAYVYIDVGHPPLVAGTSATTAEETSVDITLSSIDEKVNPTPWFEIVSSPLHGTLAPDGWVYNYPPSGTAGVVTCSVKYTPALNYNGSDSFTYKSYEGFYSNVATANVTISPVNDAPVADNFSVQTPVNTPGPVTLKATDIDLPVQTLTR